MLQWMNFFLFESVPLILISWYTLLALSDVSCIVISHGFSSLHFSFDLFLSTNISRLDMPRVELYTCSVLVIPYLFLFILYIEYAIFSLFLMNP
jgi:hypothetical protein